MEDEGLEAAARNLARKKGEQKDKVRLLTVRSSAVLGKIASGFATQGRWLRNGKVESQVLGEDRFPGRETVREVRRGRR